MASRMQILERERQRLERLLGRNPQWRAMRAAGGMPQRVAGDWQFPGLNRVQANALRQSFVFLAYQDVLAEIAATARGPRAPVGCGDAAGALAGPDRLAAAGAGALETEPEREATPGKPARVTDAGETGSRGLDLEWRASGAPVVRGPIAVPADDGATIAEVWPDDDLTRIRRIDRALAARLAAAGVTSFAQIASWSSAEVRAVARELALGKRIWRENWIEQAAVFAGRAEASPVAVPRVPAAGRAALDAFPARAADGEAASTASEPEVGRDEVGDVPATGSGEVAGLFCEAVGGLGPETGDGAGAPSDACNASSDTLSVAQGGLAAGASTDPPRGPLAGPLAVPLVVTAAEAPHEAELVTRVDAAVDEMATDASGCDGDRQAQPGESAPADVRPIWGAACKVGRRAKRLPAPSLRRLTYIRGVSEALADDLAAVGVRSVADIALWSAADVRWFRAVLGEAARISADQWIEQAQILASGQWTRHALRVVSGDFSSVVAAPDRAGPRTQPPRPADVEARPPLGAIDAADPEGTTSGRADRVRALDGGQAKHAARRQPPPLPSLRMRTVIAAPGGIEPVSLILRGLGRNGGPRPGDGQRGAPLDIDTGPGAAPAAEMAAVGACSGNAAAGAPVVAGMMPLASPPSAHAPAPSPVERQALPAAGADQAPEAPPQAFAEVPRDEPEAEAEPANLADDQPEDLAEASPADMLGEGHGVLPDSAPASGDGSRATSFGAVRDDEPTARLMASSDALSADLGSSDFVSANVEKDVADAGALCVSRKPADAPGVAARAAEPRAAARDEAAGADDEGCETFLSFGDEAAVRIVARRRAPGACEEAAPAVRPDVGRERLGYSPEFIARRLDVGVPEDGPEAKAYAGYHDAVEEATVTIIRARASEEPASSVVPERAANDQPPPADALAERPAPVDPRLKKRAFGSRFLRALTGD